jgi:dimethylamine/trimethylamine dehydrogenase
VTADSYHARLRLAYEEEVETEAYFATLAALAPHADQTAKLRLLAEIEAQTARVVAPLLARHGLTPRDDAELAAAGEAAATAARPAWADLIAGMLRTYPGYVTYFAGIEADGPPEDRAALALLTEHERAALAFLEREAAGHPDSAEPMRAYLGTVAGHLAEAGG